MRFEETALDGAYVVEIEKIGDERGFFGRAWCAKEFEQRGLASNICQINSSYSVDAGTIRGLHYQVPPHAESKYIRCTQGRIFDVIIDLRRQSPTFLQWTGIELSAAEHKMLYVPEGFAHGFVTLEPNSEVYYPVTAYYEPSAERGIRFDDPLFNIAWPVPVTVYSDKDRSHPDFEPDRDAV